MYKRKIKYYQNVKTLKKKKGSNTFISAITYISAFCNITFRSLQYKLVFFSFLMAKYFAFYHTHIVYILYIHSLNKAVLLFSKVSRESKKFVAGTHSSNFPLSVFRLDHYVVKVLYRQKRMRWKFNGVHDTQKPVSVFLCYCQRLYFPFLASFDLTIK